MRLLQHNISGQLSLTEDFVDDNIPEYATLSHTLGAASEEVTFRYLIGDTARVRLAMIRSCSAEKKQYVTVWDTFGWTRTTLRSTGWTQPAKLSEI